MNAPLGDYYEIALEDERYPASVRELSDPPETLYVNGNPHVISEASLSVIGSRRATPYGLEVARTVGTLAAESGVVEVSGGARGVDQAGAWGAIDAGGRHVMVLGTGADVVYPASARPLIKRTIEGGGAVISPFPWGTEPRRWAFPKRNRIIAALSGALFVTEAGMPSGTFSTAECAMDLGRELLVAPGSLLSPESRGANYLIANGATCIVDEESIEIAISRIYGKLRFPRRVKRESSSLSEQDEALLSALVASPLKPDEVAAYLRISVVESLRLLAELEMKGLCERMIDGRYSPSRMYLGALARHGSQ